MIQEKLKRRKKPTVANYCDHSYKICYNGSIVYTHWCGTLVTHSLLFIEMLQAIAKMTSI